MLHLLAAAALVLAAAALTWRVMVGPTATRMALMADDGYARAIYPSHTSGDGDTIFSLATGRWSGEPDITVVGALYLAVVCLIPEWLNYQYNVPFYLGGTSILIVVSVTMDTVAQIQSHLIAQQYEGLIKRAKLRGARR